MAESQNIEWKESWRDEYLKWICGFANAQGGKIYIGTNDDGTVIGILVLRTENPCANISVYFPDCTSPEYST